MLRKIRSAWKFYRTEFVCVQKEPAEQVPQHERFDAKKLMAQLLESAQRYKQSISDKFVQYLNVCACVPPLQAIISWYTEEEQVGASYAWQREGATDFDAALAVP